VKSLAQDKPDPNDDEGLDDIAIPADKDIQEGDEEQDEETDLPPAMPPERDPNLGMNLANANVNHIPRLQA
jgi:hypothetical protein